MTSESPVTRSSDDYISIADAIAFVNQWWKLILTITLLGAGIATAIALMSTRVYRAQSVIAPVSADRASETLARLAGQFGVLGGLVGDLGFGSGAGSSEVWLATLKSREVHRAFIERNGLLPILFADKWDPVEGRWQTQSDRVPTVNDALLKFDRDVLTISEDKRSGLITVAIEWIDPNLAASWSNELIAMTNASIRARVIEESQRNIAYLEQELSKTSVVERRQIIFKLIESRTGEIMLANGRPEYAFTVIDSATAPDDGKFSRPKRRLMVLIGTVLGGAVGVVLALAMSGIRSYRRIA